MANMPYDVIQNLPEEDVYQYFFILKEFEEKIQEVKGK